MHSEPRVGARGGSKATIRPKLARRILQTVFYESSGPNQVRTAWRQALEALHGTFLQSLDAIFDPIREARKARDGRQPGDPAKAGKPIAEFVTAPEPPLHLLPGHDAFEYVNKELDTLRAEFDAWKSFTRSTNSDEAASKNY